MSEQSEHKDMTPGIISWNELATNDLAGSKQFYTQLFGWTVEEMPMPEGSYSFFKVGDRPVGGMLQMPAEAKGAPTMWMGYVTVTDVKQAVEKATSLGAKVLKEITAIPGMGTFAIISDPQGAVLGLWEFADKA